MKKILLSIVASLGLFLLIPASTFALSAVSGHITDNNKDVSGASVNATCETATGSATSQPNGDYFITLTPNGVCTSNDNVVVTATKGPVSGQNSGPINSVGDDLNIALINVAVSLPELGIITGTGAAVLGGGAFFLIRRRSLSAKE
jgi:hypothetical protein